MAVFGNFFCINWALKKQVIGHLGASNGKTNPKIGIQAEKACQSTNGHQKTIDVVGVGQQSKSMMRQGDVAVDFRVDVDYFDMSSLDEDTFLALVKMSDII